MVSNKECLREIEAAMLENDIKMAEYPQSYSSDMDKKILNNGRVIITSYF